VLQFANCVCSFDQETKIALGPFLPSLPLLQRYTFFVHLFFKKNIYIYIYISQLNMQDLVDSMVDLPIFYIYEDDKK
jgi:hypothetical protein